MDTDIKKKAGIFEKTDIDKFVNATDRCDPYWMVRKVILLNLYNFLYVCLYLYGHLDLELQICPLFKILYTNTR